MVKKTICKEDNNSDNSCTNLWNSFKVHENKKSKKGLIEKSRSVISVIVELIETQ